MVQSEVLRRTRVSIQKIEDKTRQSIVRLEQRLHLKRKAVVRALASLCLPLLAIIMVIVNPVPKLGKLYMAMSEGFNGYAMFETPPIGIYNRIFVFNVTNSERFLSGEDRNVKLQELGPFTYLERRTNSNLSLDWERGVLRFIPRLNITFLPEHSVGHPRDFPVIVPNLALLTTTAMLADYSMWTNIAFNVLLANLGTKQFKSMTAEDYMWGFEDELTTVAHTVLPGWIDTPKMGLMQQFYEDQGDKFVEIDATFENRYRIRSWDGETALPHWSDGTKTGSVCNRLNGSYEAMFFTAGYTTETTFDIYRRQICRTMPMRYMSTNYTSFGVKVLQFTTADDAFEPSLVNDCVCNKKDKCLPRGLSDTSPCYKGLSLAISQPHFLDSDPSVFYKIEGLKPDRKVHGTVMSIDPEMGLPLEASSSSQSNVVIGDAKYSSIGKPFSNMVFPLLWLNMKYQEIPDHLQMVLRWRFIHGPALQTALEVILFVSGLLVLAYNVFRYMRPWSVTMDYQTIPMVEKEMELFVHKNPLMDDIDL